MQNVSRIAVCSSCYGGEAEHSAHRLAGTPRRLKLAGRFDVSQQLKHVSRRDLGYRSLAEAGQNVSVQHPGFLLQRLVGTTPLLKRGQELFGDGRERGLC